MSTIEGGSFSEVECTQCGARRIKRDDGTPGACSLIGCPAPLHDVDVEQGRRPPPPRRLEIMFNIDTKKVDITPADRATYAWMHQRNVVDFLASKLPEMRGRKVTRDRRPDEVEPPADVMTPKRIAAWMQDALRLAFPDEDVTVAFTDPTTSPRVHEACPTCSCASTRPGASSSTRSAAD